MPSRLASLAMVALCAAFAAVSVIGDRVPNAVVLSALTTGLIAWGWPTGATRRVGAVAAKLGIAGAGLGAVGATLAASSTTAVYVGFLALPVAVVCGFVALIVVPALRTDAVAMLSSAATGVAFAVCSTGWVAAAREGTSYPTVAFLAACAAVTVISAMIPGVSRLWWAMVLALVLIPVLTRSVALPGLAAFPAALLWVIPPVAAVATLRTFTASPASTAGAWAQAAAACAVCGGLSHIVAAIAAR